MPDKLRAIWHLSYGMTSKGLSENTKMKEELMHV